MSMKKISVILTCGAVLLAIMCVAYTRIMPSRIEKYRTMSGTLSNQDTEYHYTAALSPMFADDVARMSKMLDDNAVDYMIHEPEILELWVAEKDVARVKRLFQIDMRGFIVLDSGTRGGGGSFKFTFADESQPPSSSEQRGTPKH